MSGPRTSTRHIPYTPEQLAAEALACRSAGATAVHIHVRDDQLMESFSARHVDDVLDAIRTYSSGLPVSLTTGAWIVADPDERLETITSWRSLPDSASVNWHEPGAARVADALLDRGVGVEAGLWNERAIEQWTRWPRRAECARALLELPGGLDPHEVRDRISHMHRLVAERAPEVPVQAHGEEDTTWAALDHAMALGVEARIGFEDTLTMPSGTAARSNADLVTAALTRHEGWC